MSNPDDKSPTGVSTNGMNLDVLLNNEQKNTSSIPGVMDRGDVPNFQKNYKATSRFHGAKDFSNKYYNPDQSAQSTSSAKKSLQAALEYANKYGNNNGGRRSHKRLPKKRKSNKKRVNSRRKSSRRGRRASRGRR